MDDIHFAPVEDGYLFIGKPKIFPHDAFFEVHYLHRDLDVQLKVDIIRADDKILKYHDWVLGSYTSSLSSPLYWRFRSGWKVNPRLRKTKHTKNKKEANKLQNINAPNTFFNFYFSSVATLLHAVLFYFRFPRPTISRKV